MNTEKSKIESNQTRYFDKEFLIVTWLLSVQGLHSVNDANSEGGSTDFKSDLISETLWYHFFYWFDVLLAEDSLCSELSCGCIFLLTHTFGKLSCFIFILGFTMIIFLLYLTNRCDNTPLFFLGNLWQSVQLGRNGQNSLHQAWQFFI